MAYTEDVQPVPRGWKVRTVSWPSGHEVRLAFPRGPRKRGSGRLVSILHPHGNRGRRNPGCPNPEKITFFEIWKHGESGPELVAVERDQKQAEMIARQKGRQESAKYTVQTFKNTFKSPEAKAAYVAGLSAVSRGLGRKLAAKRAARGGAYYHGKPFRYTNRTSAKTIEKQIDWMEKRRAAGKDPSGRPLSAHYVSELGKDIDRAKTMLAHKRGNPCRKKNPDDTEAAAALYRQFHGQDPKEIITTQISAEQRKDYSVVGPLEDIDIVAVNGRSKRLSFHSDKVMVASSPNGKTLYFIGGNQKLSDDLLRGFGADSTKDQVVLGTAAYFSYWDRKKESQWKLVLWKHKLGEDGGTQPVTLYDKLQERVFFGGGSYYIRGTWVMN